MTKAGIIDVNRDIEFLGVRKPVPVGVRVMRIRAELVFLQIRQAITVGVKAGVVDERIQSVPDFPAIRHTVAVEVSGVALARAAGVVDILNFHSAEGAVVNARFIDQPFEVS
jgi:hypothetical protein